MCLRVPVMKVSSSFAFPVHVSASTLNAVYDAVLCQLNPRSVPILTRTMEAFLFTCPQEFAQFLLESGKLGLMLRSCLASTEELSQTLQDYAEADISVVSYMGVCARVILLAPHILPQACSQLVTNGTLSALLHLSL